MNPKWLVFAPVPVWVTWASYLAVNPDGFSQSFLTFWVLNDIGIVVALLGFLLWLVREPQAGVPVRHHHHFLHRRARGH